MKDEYKPRYAKGHLLVNFKEDSPEGMPKYLEKNSDIK